MSLTSRIIHDCSLSCELPQHAVCQKKGQGAGAYRRCMQEQKLGAHVGSGDGEGISGSRFRPGTEVAKASGLPRPNILLVTTDQQVLF